jgi:hypothetical protein
MNIDFSNHPINLGVRFLLEIGALLAFGYWGWHLVDGPLHNLLGIGIPVIIAAAWGVFGVTGDTRGGGRSPVPVAGPLRLALELAVLFGAGLALAAAGKVVWGAVFAAIVLVQTIASLGRIRWLLRH